MNENSLANLKPFTSEQSRELAKINGKKGGLVAGENRRKKKLLKDTINEFLETTNPATGNTFQIDLVNSMLNKAIVDGDVSAFNTLRDTSGQKPKEEIQAVVMPMINIKGL
jgi:hypothetical protein